METWLPAVLAFAGAIGGVWLGNVLGVRRSKSEARRERLEGALKAVAAAIAARNYGTVTSSTAKPAFVSEEDLREVWRTNYLRQIDSLFATLQEARREVGVLAAYGLEFNGVWREAETMEAHLGPVYEELRGLLDLK